MTAWLIVSSKQNFEITAGLNFSLQGLKKRHRKKALEIQPGDVFFYYITGNQQLAGMTRIQSPVEIGDDFIWVNLGKDPSECYPWRFEMQPEIILPTPAWIPMSEFAEKLLHFRKWPAKNWRLGLQGQIHRLRPEDHQTLLDGLRQIQPR